MVTEDPIADTAVATDSIKPQTATGNTVVLSRSECLRIALQESPVIKIADMEITRLDLAKKETRASLLPQIDFTGAYQRALALQTVSMEMGGETQSFKMGTDNTWNFGFSASVPLVAPRCGSRCSSARRRYSPTARRHAPRASIWLTRSTRHTIR